jgi:hypothetical protein
MPIYVDGFLTVAAKLEYKHLVQGEPEHLKIVIGLVFYLLQDYRHLEAKLRSLDLAQ